jgi:hypothetical protein
MAAETTQGGDAQLALAAAGPNSMSGKLEEPDHSSANWYFSREEIEKNSPSRKDGIDLKKETYFRKSYCTFLQDLGMRLKVLVFSQLLFPSTPGIVSHEIVFSIATPVLCATPQRFGKNSTSLQPQFHLMKWYPQAVSNNLEIFGMRSQYLMMMLLCSVRFFVNVYFWRHEASFLML